MKLKTFCLASLIVAPLGVQAGGGGGLNAISVGGTDAGAEEAYGVEQPLKFTLSAEVGHDTNVLTSAIDDDSASFVVGTLAANYSQRSETMGWSLGASYSALYYFDDVPGLQDDVMHDARITSSYYRQVDERLSFAHSLYLTYEFEPNFESGASTTYRDDGQYFYGYNDIAVSYAWAPRFATTTGYTLSGVAYDEGEIADSEDRLVHIFRQEFRYSLSPVTTLIAEYRYQMTDFDNDDLMRDSDQHYALAGLEHQIDETTSASIRAGASFAEYDNGYDKTKPYLEAGIRHRLGENTSIRWLNRLGYEDSETNLDDTQSRYTYRTSLRATQQFSERLKGSAVAHYEMNEFTRTSAPDYDRDGFGLGFDASYIVYENVSLTASYRYTNVSSDLPNRDYDRNVFSVGVSTTF